MSASKNSDQTIDSRKIAARILVVLTLVFAIVMILVVWSILERHPRTDDAVVRANVVGIAPRVSGQIITLNVADNQAVREGDVLFEIDPEDYRLAVDRAKAALAGLDQQIAVAQAEDAQLRFQVKGAEASLLRARAELRQTSDTLARTEPLLPKGFAVADDVDKARTARDIAAASVSAEEERLNQAKSAISALATLTAQRPGLVAALELAQLELSYCKVVAPFPGRIVGLNISAGAHVTTGVPVFSLLDTRRWYVIANFREGELPHLGTGSPVKVYLPSAPNRLFRGAVQGVGWAVEPQGEIDLPGRVPLVRRELNWVHVAQRFPVRIEIEDPDPELFRMGASAVAIIESSHPPRPR